MNSFDKASAEERINKSLLVVSRASDKVRTSLIDSLLNQEASSKSAFFAIHKAHFEENPLLSQFHHDYLLEHPNITVDYVQAVSEKVKGDYSSVIGCLRTNNPKVGDIEFPNFEDLPPLADRFFKAVDSYEAFDSEEDFWNFILTVDIFLRGTHLPYDGSGRTNEDFLSLLCKKFNYNFTLSKSGFRGMLSGDLVVESDYLKDLLKFDIDNLSDGSYLVMVYRILGVLENGDFDNLKSFNKYYSHGLNLYKEEAQKSSYRVITEEDIRELICKNIGSLVGEPVMIRVDRLKEYSEALGLN